MWRRFNTIISLENPSFELRKEIIREYSKILPSDYVNDIKRVNELAKIMDGFSPADIKNVIQKVAKKSVISKLNRLLYSQIVYQVCINKSSMNTSIEELISSMLKYKVTQKEIAETLNISLRQVRNVVRGVKENE